MRGRRALILVAAVNALLLGTVVVVLLRASAGDRAADADWHGTPIIPPMEKQPFMLQAAAGPLRSSDLRGDVTILFFGYTRCPDACPLTLARIAEARRALGSQGAADVRVVLVSIDPEHDTPARLDAYVARFDTSFTGATGTRTEIEAIARDFGIFHAPESASAESAAAHGGHAAPQAEAPVIAHTTHVLVLDRAGRLALLWSPEIGADAMVDDLQRLLRT